MANNTDLIVYDAGYGVSATRDLVFDNEETKTEFVQHCDVLSLFNHIGECCLMHGPGGPFDRANAEHVAREFLAKLTVFVTRWGFGALNGYFRRCWQDFERLLNVQPPTVLDNNLGQGLLSAHPHERNLDYEDIVVVFYRG